MNINQILDGYAATICFLLAAVGTMLLAPKPLLPRHIWGIELTMTGVLLFSVWNGWSFTHSWLNVVLGLLITAITDLSAYRHLTKLKG